MTYRGTTNRNARGSAAERRKRKQWLIDEYGNGITVVCHLGTSRKCLKILTIETVSVDRHPIPGCMGGKYTRENIRPSCRHCNEQHGGILGNERKRSKTPERQKQ